MGTSISIHSVERIQKSEIQKLERENKEAYYTQSITVFTENGYTEITLFSNTKETLNF